MIEGCGLCPTVRSGVVAGRWIPDAFDALVRVGGPASPAPVFPTFATAGAHRERA